MLSPYYDNQAHAYSGLGRTGKAVDAAAGAIISWGRHVHQRQQRLHRLEEILRNAKDLDAYAESLDVEVEETGLENPIVRKALGRVYHRKRQYARAAHHLRLAVENQPNDMETHKLLVDTYDRMRRPDLAAGQLLRSAAISFLKEAESGISEGDANRGIVRHHLALAYEANEEPQKALDTVEKALAALEAQTTEAKSKNQDAGPEPAWASDMRVMQERLRKSIEG